jgi:hypothetical protein
VSQFGVRTLQHCTTHNTTPHFGHNANCPTLPLSHRTHTKHLRCIPLATAERFSPPASCCLVTPLDVVSLRLVVVTAMGRKLIFWVTVQKQIPSDVFILLLFAAMPENFFDLKHYFTPNTTPRHPCSYPATCYRTRVQLATNWARLALWLQRTPPPPLPQLILFTETRLKLLKENFNHWTTIIETAAETILVNWMCFTSQWLVSTRQICCTCWK